ncbi:MAG TPA: hypothetical protein VKA67_02595 [Verrucomicrobiae bacterium]|nr:hypothetical protein [Verrucomicrobiae bacterium]
MFTRYIIAVDADVNVHNTSEVLFHLTANTDPQRFHFHQRPVRRARPCHQRNRQRQQTRH